MKVLVVGAGPTGLTAALELARQGLLPDIVERRTEPSRLSRAVGIMPESIDKLRLGGASNSIEKEAMKLTKVNIYHGEKPLVNLDFTKLHDQPVRTILGLPQNRTEALIADALGQYGVEVQYGCEVTDIETNDQKAKVQFNNVDSGIYDWVIGADGRHSIVRKQLGIHYPGIDLDGEWSIADVDANGYDPALVSIWVQDEIDGKGAFFMILPIEKERVRIVSSTPDVLANLPIDLDISNIRRTGKFLISVRQAETYLRGRVLLAGDAAHCHSPVGGRGMNLGIDDAVAAAMALIEGTTDEYSDARHELGEKVLNDSERTRKAVTSTDKIAQLSTKALFSMVGHSQILQQLVLKQLTSL